MKPHRKHPLWFAYALHRLSGLALALFLPVHFYFLSLALHQPDRLDDFLHWAATPVAKLAEFGLVFLLAVHMFGGLRLLAMEFLPWSAHQKSLAAGAFAAAFCVSCAFLLNAV